MDRIQVLPLRTVPRWAIIGLIAIGLILVGFIFKFVDAWISPNDQFVTITFLNGEVEVSDGFAGTRASKGPLPSGNVDIFLTTGDGTAGLQLPDGSFVIVDSDSTIEFMQKDRNDPFQAFAFNLIRGRVLVVSEKTSRTPTQILLGGTEIVVISRATVGLVATNADEVRGRVDCLQGECLVNGVYLLASGQNAQIGPKNIVKVTVGILTDTWSMLSKADGTSRALSLHFERILLALANPVIPTGSTIVAKQVIPITGMNIISATPSPSGTLWLTGTATLTQTNFFFRRVLPSPTSSGNNYQPPPATFTLVWTPTPTRTPTSTRTPTATLIPSKTLTPSATIPPTATSIPTQTFTATISPTPTPIPTATITPTPKPTNTPKPTPTPKPTHTPRNTPTNTPTIMPTNTPTIMPTDTPTNTVEPSPMPTFTDTPVPTNPA